MDTLFIALSYYPFTPNLRAIMIVGKPDTHSEIVKSRKDFSNVKNIDESKLADTPLPSPVFNPQDLIG
jgi:hypothetical protein